MEEYHYDADRNDDVFRRGLIPKYLLVKNMGLIDTYWALIIPSAMTTWNLIIMRTAFQGVPDALEESARIDGASDWTILFRIIIPLSLPVIAVMVLFYGVWHWNKWFDALIYLRDRDLFPLQLILREILIQNDTSSMMTSVGGETGCRLARRLSMQRLWWLRCRFCFYIHFCRNIL